MSNKTQPDWDYIKARYEKATLEAELERRDNAYKSRLIPAYIVAWENHLDEVQRRIYEDIRCVGIPLRPWYPVDKYFISFGAPFYKIGIHIRYANTPFDVSAKLEKIKELGWTIYTFESKYVYESAESLYNRINGTNLYFNELDVDERTAFINRYHMENSECLVFYLKKTYFSENYSEDENTSI